jgi:hypothetical protein
MILKGAYMCLPYSLMNLRNNKLTKWDDLITGNRIHLAE